MNSHEFLWVPVWISMNCADRSTAIQFTFIGLISQMLACSLIDPPLSAGSYLPLMITKKFDCRILSLKSFAWLDCRIMFTSSANSASLVRLRKVSATSKSGSLIFWKLFKCLKKWLYRSTPINREIDWKQCANRSVGQSIAALFDCLTGDRSASHIRWILRKPSHKRM